MTRERRIHNQGKYDGDFHMTRQLLSMIVALVRHSVTG